MPQPPRPPDPSGGESVLESTKKILGISQGDKSFDLDVITHINSAFSILHQAGVGVIQYIDSEDDTWDDCFGDNPEVPLVKTCVYLQVRLLFDPPATSFLITAAQQQVQEHIWRLNVHREETEWVDPDPPGLILDV